MTSPPFPFSLFTSSNNSNINSSNNNNSKGRRNRIALFISLALVSFVLGLITSQFWALLLLCSPSPPPPPPPSETFPADLLQFQTQCGVPSVPSPKVRGSLIDRFFDGVSPFEGFPPPHAQPWLHKSRVKGWGSNASVFARLVKEVRPSVVLELGTFLGASALHMSTLLLQTTVSDSANPPLILCVDDFRGWPGFREKLRGSLRMVNGDVSLLYQFMQNVYHLNMTETILPLPFSTSSTLRALCDMGVYADLIEVDAAHDFHSAWADINFAHALLSPRGVIFGHDYYTRLDNRGVGRAVDLFARLKGLRVEPDGQHWILRNK